ncbi:MAG: DNA polymerase domain-containing protein [Candidatus Geothermarchaeales archaeon]
MGSDTGWILDVYVQGGEAVLWIRTEDGHILRLTDGYAPDLYILPRTREDLNTLYRVLGDHPSVVSAALEERYTELGSDVKDQLLCVVIDGATHYREILRMIQILPQVKALFNVDLLHVQRYLYALGIEPTSEVEVEYNDGNRLTSIKRLDDELEIAPPPFTTLSFDIHISSETLTPKADRDPITGVEAMYGGERLSVGGEETDVLEKLAVFIQERDPDFLICPECDEVTFPYLFRRVKLLGLDLRLGREPINTSKLRKPLPYWVRGRVAVSSHHWGNTFEAWGIAGLVERARFGFLPPGIANRWTANRIIDSRNCFELTRRGYVIKSDAGNYQYARTIDHVFSRDRGGLIFAPRIGVVHENVAELDFESQYPHLIVRDGLSYETVTPEGVERREDALLPYVTEQFLKRRLHFKRLAREVFPEGTREWLWCEQRQEALKLILCCLYGTSGCCWNRYGNVLCFEEINRLSREALLKTREYAQRRGYEVVYADTDSVFVKRPNATREDYEGLCREISRLLDLPMTLDHHYKFLVFLPLKTDPSGNVEAQKHYFGVLTNGELIARGIELRRHDTPQFVKEFQIELIKTLLRCSDAEEVRTKGYDQALRYVHETLEKLMNREVPPEQLVVSKVLRKPLGKYRTTPPHVSAATQLVGLGKELKAGEHIDFIYVDVRNPNPLQRVRPKDLYDARRPYNSLKYRDLVLDAAETVLSTFGFSKGGKVMFSKPP